MRRKAVSHILLKGSILFAVHTKPAPGPDAVHVLPVGQPCYWKSNLFRIHILNARVLMPTFSIKVGTCIVLRFASITIRKYCDCK
jgi:hypothetical protein